MTRLLVTTLAMLGLFLDAGPAAAHAHLRGSMPANEARLAQAPVALTLDFSEPARLTVLELRSSGQSIAIPLDRDAKASARIVVPLPPLKPGSYAVEWRVIAADDGHVTHGSISFIVLGS